MKPKQANLLLVANAVKRYFLSLALMNPKEGDNLAVAEEYLRLRDALRRLDTSIANIEDKEARARQRGRIDEVVRLTTKRTALETSRASTQAAFERWSQEMETIRALIREETNRRRILWRSEPFRDNLRWLFFISLLSITVTFWIFLVLSR